MIVPGAYADILLFDDTKVGRGPLDRVYDLPGGEDRFIREPLGVHGLWINGIHVYDGSDYIALNPAGEVIDSFSN